MLIINDKICNRDIINLDEGYFSGKGLFETIYVKNKPVFLEEHLNRLNNGLSRLNIKKNISKEYFLDVLRIMRCKNCAIKLMVSDDNIIFVDRKISYTRENYEKGFSIVVSNIKRNPFSHMTYLKSFNFYDNIIERESAINRGYDEVLFLNTEGYVSEGSISNIFYIKDSVIYTPDLKCGLLNGVVRSFIINNYKKHMIYETRFDLGTLLKADGVFITNSIMGIMKVSKINNKVIGSCKQFEDITTFYNDYLKRF